MVCWCERLGRLLQAIVFLSFWIVKSMHMQLKAALLLATFSFIFSTLVFCYTRQIVYVGHVIVRVMFICSFSDFLWTLVGIPSSKWLCSSLLSLCSLAVFNILYACSCLCVIFWWFLNFPFVEQEADRLWIFMGCLNWLMCRNMFIFFFWGLVEWVVHPKHLLS